MVSSCASSGFVYNSWYAVLLSAIFWTVVYFGIRHILPKKSPEWCSRAVTFLHGFGAAANGLSECFNGDLFRSAAEPQTDNQQMIILFSLGYFIFDFAWCMYFQLDCMLMLVHHGYSMVALLRMLYKNQAGAETACGIGGMEITNPILQIRWFLRYEGYQHTKWFTGVEISFVVLFLIMRLIFGTYFIINVLFLLDDWEYRGMTAILYIISLLFILNLARYMYQKYAEGKIPHEGRRTE